MPGPAKEVPYRTPKPSLPARIFFRLPVYLYRLRLGWVFDHRILYLVHVGRKTGKTRRNCIEVIHRDQQTNESFVISAYGSRSDWLRNIMKAPPLELRIGRERFVPEFRVLDATEARRVLGQAFAQYPAEGRFFLKHVFHLPASEEQFEDLSELVPLVAFRPNRR